MSHEVKVRKGNNSGTKFITIPSEIANLYDIKIGTILQFDVMSSDQLKITVKKGV